MSKPIGGRLLRKNRLRKKWLKNHLRLIYRHIEKIAEATCTKPFEWIMFDASVAMKNCKIVKWDTSGGANA